MPAWLAKLGKVVTALVPIGRRMADRIRARRAGKTGDAIEELRAQQLKTPRYVRRKRVRRGD